MCVHPQAHWHQWRASWLSTQDLRWVTALPMNKLPIYTSVRLIPPLSFLYQGGCIHDGTWQSAIYGFADSHKLQSLRRKFNHKPLPTVGSKLRRRCIELIPFKIFSFLLVFSGFYAAPSRKGLSFPVLRQHQRIKHCVSNTNPLSVVFGRLIIKAIDCRPGNCPLFLHSEVKSLTDSRGATLPGYKSLEIEIILLLIWLIASLNSFLIHYIMAFSVCGCVCVYRGALFFSNEIQQYTVPFMGSDPSVVKRSQRFLHEEYQATPVSPWITLLISAN